MYHQKAADFYPSGACAKVENELLFLLPLLLSASLPPSVRYFGVVWVTGTQQTATRVSLRERTHRDFTDFKIQLGKKLAF